MNTVENIYQKYISVFYEIDAVGTWIDLAAVRYALRAALRELAAAQPAVDIIEEHRHLDGIVLRIERVLEAHDSDVFADLVAGNIELPTAIDAVIDSYKSALAAAEAAQATTVQIGDDPELSDYIIGLDAGRHTWRTIPKPVRWRLITATLRSIWEDGRRPSMDDFNAAKPAWMPVATAIAASYGDGKWTTVCGKAAQP